MRDEDNNNDNNRDEEAGIDMQKKLELDDDDDYCPVPFNSAEFEDVDVTMRKIHGKKPGIIDDDDCPIPFNSAAYEDPDVTMRKVNGKKPEIIDDNDCPLPFNSADYEDDDERAKSHMKSGIIDNNEIDDNTAVPRAVSPPLPPAHTAFDEQMVNDNGNGVLLDNDVVAVEEDDEEAAIHIPTAFLVEENEDRGDEVVYDAIPSVPWWKQRRTKILFGAVFILLVSLAIALGVTLSSSNTITEVVSVSATEFPSKSLVPSSTPTLTLVPTSNPSLQPSFNPSSSPTTYLSTYLWNQEGQVINGNAAYDESGFSVSLAGDGNTLAVGSPGNLNKDKHGHVTIYYKKDNGTHYEWQTGDTFMGDTIGDWFGRSVSLSRDGTTLAIGAPGYWEKKDRSGHVRIYHLVDTEGDSAWEMTKTIEGEALGDQFGWSVSLSDDGRSLAVGAPFNDGGGDYAGHVRVYTAEGKGGNEYTQINGTAGVFSGYFVSLSGNGKILAVGSYGHGGDNFDSIRVYKIDEHDNKTNWLQFSDGIIGEVTGWLGSSAALSHDGETLAIGAHWNDNGANLGHVRVFRLNSDSTDWDQIGEDLDGYRQEEDEDEFGHSLSLSSSGTTIAVGAYGDAAQKGFVQLYNLKEENSTITTARWVQVGDDIDGAAIHDSSGWSVSLSSDGKAVAIGSPLADEKGYTAGHVRVFGLEEEPECPEHFVDDIDSYGIGTQVTIKDKVYKCIESPCIWKVIGTCTDGMFYATPTLQPTDAPTSSLIPTSSPSSSLPPSASVKPSSSLAPTPVPACDESNPQECGCASVNQIDYRGKMNATLSGYECMEWDFSGSNFHPADYPDANLNNNYCRNPDPLLYGDFRVWCYTEPFGDLNQNWEYCSVPMCEERGDGGSK